MLRRSLKKLKLYPTDGANPWHGWERVPYETYNGAVVCPMWPKLNYKREIAKGRKLRGSGTWGVENTSVMRMILYNRVKQIRPQRTVPTLEESQSFNQVEVAITWFSMTLFFLMMPLTLWTRRYSIVHETHPWMPQRIDGTHGEGGYRWFIE